MSSEFDSLMFDPIVVVLFVIIIMAIGITMIFWDALFDPNYQLPRELKQIEKDKVREFSCSELKDYILLSFDGKYRSYYQGTFAKELFVWKCEK